MQWDEGRVFGTHQSRGNILCETHQQIIVDRIGALRRGKPQDGDRPLIGWDWDRLSHWFGWGLDDGFRDHLGLFLLLHHEREKDGTRYQERENAEGNGLRPLKRQQSL